MRRAPAGTLAFLLGLAGPWARAAQRIEPVSPDPEVLGLQQSFRHLARTIAPAVVRIETEGAAREAQELGAEDPFELFRRFFEGFEGQEPPLGPQERRSPRRPPAGIGSGVLVDPRGYILTNEHVVGDAKRIKVTISGPRPKEYRGRIVGKDAFSDLAVVKIDARQDLPAAPLGDSARVAPGDWAMAVGSPFGLEQSVTVGVVSAVREEGVQVEGRTYTGFIQTDAAINRGNSGGPLLNIRGEVIGINTAIYAPAGGFVGVGFAIPSNTARKIMEQLIAKGKVVRGWLGVEVAPVDEVMARQFEVPGGKGALVNQVLEDSPALRAGIRRGDVIVRIAGKAVESPDDLVRTVTSIEPGQRVPAVLIRDGRRETVDVAVGSRPEPSALERARPSERGAESGWQGAQLRTASPELNARLNLPRDARGVVVVSLDPGLAEEMGLKPGDIIVSVNRRPTPDTESFLKAVREGDLKEGIVLDVNRRGRRMYLSFQKPA